MNRLEMRSQGCGVAPAPKDKHAADPKQAQKADKEMHDKLNKGLEGTFPARWGAICTRPA
jgi:hypothetical protein